jgi:hypothetical protein
MILADRLAVQFDRLASQHVRKRLARRARNDFIPAFPGVSVLPEVGLEALRLHCGISSALFTQKTPFSVCKQ